MPHELTDLSSNLVVAVNLENLQVSGRMKRDK